MKLRLAAAPHSSDCLPAAIRRFHPHPHTPIARVSKAKLAAPLAGQIDGALGHAAGAVAGVDVGSIASGLGAMFEK
jgi:hypothetical protein